MKLLCIVLCTVAGVTALLPPVSSGLDHLVRAASATCEYYRSRPRVNMEPVKK